MNPKYHNNGFSWRNLENIPEILDVNKTPELRKFINTIISFLKQSHISTTVSGLYNFKFPMKITEEISLASKFSEEVSALFNFTLDDSLSVKRHYQNLLKYYISVHLSKSNSDLSVNNDSPGLHHIVSGIHHILGDLHLFDEEYNEAIYEYQCCIQKLEQDSPRNDDPHHPSHIIHSIRIMLKLALAHEKRKTYNSAYIVYNELISKLIQFRYFDESEFGLKYLQKIKNGSDAQFWHSKIDVLYNDENKRNIFEKKIHPRVVLFDKDYRDMVRRYKKSKDRDFTYEIEGQDMISQLSRQLSPEKYNLIVKLTAYEDIRLIYQGILAKLFLLEKKGLNGITKECLETMESEFNFLHRSVNTEEKYIISADFFRKVADILYYKNGFICKSNSDYYFTGWYLWDYNIENDIINYCSVKGYSHYKTLKKLTLIKGHCDDGNITYKSGLLLRNEIDTIKTFLNNISNRGISISNTREDINVNEGYIELIQDPKIAKCDLRRRKILIDEDGHENDYSYKRMPCYACKYYNRSLRILSKNLLGEEEFKHDLSKSIIFLKGIKSKEKMLSLKETDFVVLAYALDGLGNTMLSCSHHKDKITKQFLHAFFEFVQKSNIDDIEKLPELSHLEKAILYLWAAAYYFKFSSNRKEASFCYKKVMQILVEYASINNSLNRGDDFKNCFDDNTFKNIRTEIFKRAIQNLYSHYENTNITEIQKIKWMLSKQMYEKIPLNLLSVFPDLEEILLAYVELELCCELYDYKLIKSVYNSSFLSSDRMVYTFSERIFSLRLKAMINMKIINQLFDYEKKIYEKNFASHFYNELLCYLNQNFSLTDKLGKYKKIIDENLLNDKAETKFKLLEFLIEDTMFCCSKIIEVMSPTVKSTLFTNSYMANIYHLLFECNLIYELLFMSYKWSEIDNANSEEKSEILTKLLKFNECRCDLEELLDKIKEENGLTLSSEVFFKEIFNIIDKSNIHVNISNYLAEMALKKYKRSREMHREGAAYREMISNMYFLNDDLNNDTCQFYFAIERYAINSKLVDENIKKLKKICKTSHLLDVNNYI